MGTQHLVLTEPIHNTWTQRVYNETTSTTACSVTPPSQGFPNTSKRLLIVTTCGGTVNTPPTGFAALTIPGFTLQPKFYIWWKIGDGSETAAITWTQTASNYRAYFLIFENVDLDHPIIGVKGVQYLNKSIALTSPVPAPVGAKQVFIFGGRDSTNIWPSVVDWGYIFYPSGNPWGYYGGISYEEGLEFKPAGWNSGGAGISSLGNPNSLGVEVFERSMSPAYMTGYYKTRGDDGYPLPLITYSMNVWGYALPLDCISFILFPKFYKTYSTSVKFAQTIADVSVTAEGETDVGDWVNPSNAVSSNDVYATFTATNSGHATDWLKGTNFDFASEIPPSAIITGAEFFIERKHGLSAGTAPGWVRETMAMVIKGVVQTLGERVAPPVPVVVDTLAFHVDHNGYTYSQSDDYNTIAPYWGSTYLNCGTGNNHCVLIMVTQSHAFSAANPPRFWFDGYGSTTPCELLAYTTFNGQTVSLSVLRSPYIPYSGVLGPNLYVALWCNANQPAGHWDITFLSMQDLNVADLVNDFNAEWSTGTSNAPSAVVSNPRDINVIMGSAYADGAITATAPATSIYTSVNGATTRRTWIWTSVGKTMAGAINDASVNWGMVRISMTGTKGAFNTDGTTTVASPTDSTVTVGSFSDLWDKDSLPTRYANRTDFGVAYRSKLITDHGGGGNSVASVDAISGRLYFRMPSQQKVLRKTMPVVARTFNGTTSLVTVKGSGALIDAPYALNLDPYIGYLATFQTVMVGCRPTGTNGTTGIMVLTAHCNNDFTKGTRLVLQHNAGAPYFQFGSDSTGAALKPTWKTTAVAYGNYYDVAAVWMPFRDGLQIDDIYLGVNGGSMQVAFGGSQSGSGQGTTNSGTTPFHIGNSGGSTDGFVGEIHYVAKWVRALDPSELESVRLHGPLSSPGGLVLYWANGKDLSPVRQDIVVSKHVPITHRREDLVHNIQTIPMEFLYTPPITQKLHPTGDSNPGNWMPSLPGAPLAEMLDDVPRPDDSDYIYSPEAPTTQEVTILFMLPANPPVEGNPDTQHIIRYRLQAIGLDTDFDISLVQGTDVLDTWTEAVAVVEGVAARQKSLSAGVIATITNYGNLRIQIVAHAT